MRGVNGKYRIEDDKIVNIATGRPIPTDEPIFIFRAKDNRAVSALMHYMTLVYDRDNHKSVSEAIQKFNEWRKNNKSVLKDPD